jgi:ATP-dependent DNA helicase RecQ
LRQKTPVTLTKPAEKPESKPRVRAGAIACDEALFEKLRVVRRELADERNVPAYVIFSDASLREMAQKYPRSREEFAGISGVGQQKLTAFSHRFIDEIKGFLETNPQRFF